MNKWTEIYTPQPSNCCTLCYLWQCHWMEYGQCLICINLPTALCMLFTY